MAQALGKRCGKCGKKNHFTALCRQKTVHTVEDANIDSNDGEDFYIECIHSTTQKDQAFVEFTCNGTEMPFKIDTGAQVNVLPKSDFDKLSIHQPLTQIPRRTLIHASSRRGTCRPSATQGTSGPP